MFYFSLATLTTTGYGDIVPLNPFARSLANLESIIEPFCLAVTVARLVTLEPEDRRGQRCQGRAVPEQTQIRTHPGDCFGSNLFLPGRGREGLES